MKLVCYLRECYFQTMFRRGSKQRMRRTLEERWLYKFLHQSVFVRWLIILTSVAGLVGLSVLGGRLEPSDIIEGQISPRTFVAHVNFSCLDEYATNQERDRQASAAPTVYRISTDVFQGDLRRTERLFERLSVFKQGTKISEPKLKQIADIWNEGAEVPLTVQEVQSLITIPDREGFLTEFKKLHARLAEDGIADDKQFSNPEIHIALTRRPEDPSQLRHTKAGQIPTISQARQRLREELTSSLPLPRGSLKAVEHILTEAISSNDLQFDPDLSSKLQEQWRNRVTPVFHNITRGNILIERGERLTKDKLEMLKAHEAEAEREFSAQGRWRQRVGMALLVLMILGGAILILEFSPTTEKKNTTNRGYAILATILLLHFAVCRLAIFTADTYADLSSSIAISVIPSCFGPMLVAILLDPRRAHVTAFVSSFLLGVITQFSFTVMLTSLISSVVAIHLVHPLRRRARIYEAGLLAGVAGAAVMIVFAFMSDAPWRVMGLQSIMVVMAGLAAGLLINGFLPVFESLFRVTTDLRWLELADLNHPLLQRMIMEAPGTYHHSLVVANLAERACEAIGAHALQARVCSYFHDIGKLNKTGYFSENQVESENPHNDLEPNMSALIIISHVKDGVDMAIQHRMARPIVDTIQQHHGTSHVTYFYRIAKRYEEDAKLGSKIMLMNTSDVPHVEETTYRYPGPKPSTREIGVISLADSVEGAARCLLKPTPQKIEALVAEIVDERYRDGQLEDCPISIRDLRLVADSFSKTLLSMMHTRVSYPKDEADIDQPASIHSAAAR